RIYFGFNEATLKDESIPQLNLVFEFLLENPNVKIEMDGHTCSIGSDEYNQKLSEERALAVREYLINKGIKPKRITSVGHGEANPLATNETEDGRILNRRVEFVIKDM
ncbi:MAG: OmpA family protein, partial [Cyclobacteriaceae bacterium]|nr:OmpA family protein [Cyclobacteriaceae bacterium]